MLQEIYSIYCICCKEHFCIGFGKKIVLAFEGVFQFEVIIYLPVEYDHITG